MRPDSISAWISRSESNTDISLGRNLDTQAQKIDDLTVQPFRIADSSCLSQTLFVERAAETPERVLSTAWHTRWQISRRLTEHGADMQLDRIDHIIIAALAADARVSMAALSEISHLSRAAVHARFARLKCSGVIAGFSVRINPVLAGLNASAFVSLTLVQKQGESVRAMLKALPEVEHCASVSGSCDIIVLVRAASTLALRRDVIDRIQKMPGVQSTRTLMIFDEWSRASHIGGKAEVQHRSASQIETDS